MNLEVAIHFAQAGYCLILFVLPVMAYFRFPHRGPRGRRQACVAAIALSWLVLQIYHACTAGLESQYVQSLPPTDDGIEPDLRDGTGANAAILIAGWLLPAVTLAAAILSHHLWTTRRHRSRIPRPPTKP